MYKMFFRLVIVAGLGLLMQGCASLLGGNAAEQILGRWQSEVGGFPIEVIYTSSNVQIGNNPPIQYGLEADRLTYAQGGNQVRLLEFNGPDEMIQLDPITGTRHVFIRQAE